MRKNAIFIIFLTMIFMLTGCAAPHVGAEPESGKDVVVLESGHASKNGQTIVTLKPRPTPEPTPEVTPEPTAEPTPESETTEEIPQESLAERERGILSQSARHRNRRPQRRTEILLPHL